MKYAHKEVDLAKSSGVYARWPPVRDALLFEVVRRACSRRVKGPVKPVFCVQWEGDASRAKSETEDKRKISVDSEVKESSQVSDLGIKFGDPKEVSEFWLPEGFEVGLSLPRRGNKMRLKPTFCSFLHFGAKLSAPRNWRRVFTLKTSHQLVVELRKFYRSPNGKFITLWGLIILYPL